MRYALIIAGGSGTRLWPMSTQALPKQLIPFIDGRSLLQIAMDRLGGLLPAEQVFICAGADHKQVMVDKLPGFTADRFIAEPMGRDTLNAVGLGSAVLGRNDPEATVAIFTADHIIEPVEEFQKIVDQGFALAEAKSNALVTFGIEPTHPATGYGYLQLGQAIPGQHAEARIVDEFKEKPDQATAEKYVAAGPEKYLWNSGMFVWRASALMQAIESFAPSNYEGLSKVVGAWDTPRRDAVLAEVYPALEKISVDFAVMEPASKDEAFAVAAVPMPLRWLDVGSWTSYGQTLNADGEDNATSGCKAIHEGSKNILTVGEDPQHLIATLGCEDLIVVQTEKATLIADKKEAEKIKQLHKKVGQVVGEDYL